MTPALSDHPLARTLGGLSLGALGGAVFFALGAPLAFMLGALLTTTTAAVAGYRYAVPQILRTLVVPMLGVFLGSTFTPEVVRGMAGWAGPILVLILFILAATVLNAAFLRRAGGTDPVTAYFAAAPGGVVDMVLMAEAHGGNARTISLVHTIRILVAVCTIPVFFRYVAGVEVPSLPPGGIRILDLPLREGAILLACAAGGVVLARRLKLPAPLLTGPLALSMAAHATGLSEAAPPVEVVGIAQIVIGTALGSRFVGTTLGELRRTAVLALVSGIFLVGLAVATAFFTAPVFGPSVPGLVLALAPGGLTEMGLIALSIGVDTAFISTMHILRIALVIAGAPLGFRLLRRPEGPASRPFQQKLSDAGHGGDRQSRTEQGPAEHGEVTDRGIHPATEHLEGEGGRRRED
ncbi:MAG: AbrB family transcriptional regulator [Alphaproteobacteria bacterium]|nr:AbrB family transcriptional regulator [Alphaproteobacteria bacterium]